LLRILGSTASTMEVILPQMYGCHGRDGDSVRFVLVVLAIPRSSLCSVSLVRITLTSTHYVSKPGGSMKVFDNSSSDRSPARSTKESSSLQASALLDRPGSYPRHVFNVRKERNLELGRLSCQQRNEIPSTRQSELRNVPLHIVQVTSHGSK
jgi:hypothetical protein